MERDSNVEPPDVELSGAPELAIDIGTTDGEYYVYKNMEFGVSGDDAANDDEIGGEDSYESLDITHRATGATVHQLSKSNGPPRYKVQLVLDDLSVLCLTGVPLSFITNTTADSLGSADIE